MKRNVRLCAAILAVLALLISCGSGAQPKAKKGKKEKVPYVKGNTFADKFGADNPLVQYHSAKLVVTDIGEAIRVIPVAGPIIMSIPMPTVYRTKFIERPAGESVSGAIELWTGAKDQGGPEFTWYQSAVQVSNLGQLISSGAAFTKPVWVYDPNSLQNPRALTAVIDENGIAKADMGETSSPDAVQVAIDIVDAADIWYCCNMNNAIRNQYYRLSAFGVVIGEVAFAQAEVNKQLLHNVAVLAGAKADTEDVIADEDFSEEELAIMKDKLTGLDAKIQEQFKIDKQMTKAVNKAIAAAIAEGVELGKVIAEDAARLTQMTLARDAAGIAKYFIDCYGTEKEVQEFGKFADKQAKTNFDYGNQRMKEAKELLDKNEALFNAILADE